MREDDIVCCLVCAFRESCCCLQALRGQSYFRGSCWILLVYRCLGDCFEVFRSAHDWKGVILRVSTIHLGLLLRSLLVGDQTVLFFVMGQNV